MTSHTIVSKLYANLTTRVAELTQQGKQPHLAIVLVGDDPNSIIYVNTKRKRAEELGIDFALHRLDASASEEKVLELIDSLNDTESVNGIIVQLPLPDGLNTDKVINQVALKKDVDGLRNGSQYTPPTVRAIMELLSAYDVVVKDKKIVIVGNGRLVGAPLSKALLDLNLDVTICDQSTGDLRSCTLNADILVSATGQNHIITPAMVNEGVTIIDVDCDVDYEAVLNKVKAITPQKGGVGPLTVAFLLSNVVDAAQPVV